MPKNNYLFKFYVCVQQGMQTLESFHKQTIRYITIKLELGT